MAASAPNRPRRRLATLAIIAVVVLWAAVRWANARAKPTAELGLRDGRLASCPSSPNCVSTRAEDDEHSIDPAPLNEQAEQAITRIAAIIEPMSGSRVVERQERYLRAEFRSLLLGFVDDLEVYIDEGEGLIHFRSASRTGWSDLGVNRQRVEEIKRRYQSQ